MANKHTCKRCGYEWESRYAHPPRACPKCKSYRWALPVKERRPVK
jgi:predicted Zn-ribbon and HTH transcriptional regulator